MSLDGFSLRLGWMKALSVTMSLYKMIETKYLGRKGISVPYLKGDKNGIFT